MENSQSIERKLIKCGSSVCVVLSTHELERLNLEAGDPVSIAMTDGGILIQPRNQSEGAVPSKFTAEMDSIMGDHEETFKGLVDR